jgi:uncharacterized membrane protein (UPF0127 family)
MKNARLIRPFLLPLLAMFVIGCRQQTATPASGLPTVEMKIGARNYQLEVAADDYSRMHGLMERDSMPEEHGMIFVFTQDTNEGFWMHNTRIPLDIVFIDSSGKVVSVNHMKPFDESITSAGGSYRYAIELNDGAAAANGVKAGDSVVIPAGIAR